MYRFCHDIVQRPLDPEVDSREPGNPWRTLRIPGYQTGDHLHRQPVGNPKRPQPSDTLGTIYAGQNYSAPRHPGAPR